MSAAQIGTQSVNKTFVDEKVLEDFKNSLRGKLITTKDNDYDNLRKVWNGLIDKHPALIVLCSGVADVIAAVTFAREKNILLSVRGGGHNVAGRAVCDDGIVIDLSSMRGIRVDPVNQTVTVQGGATLGDIDHETYPFGLAVPFGLVSKTGIAGLCLHGGAGWLSRKYGLTLDNLLSVDIVTSDGKMRRASESENPDLFWAIRGGGGNFGIVTSFEFRAYPIPSKVWFTGPVYPVSEAKKVLRFVTSYMKEAPEELSLIATLWDAPEDPKVPLEYHGSPIIMLLGCYHGQYDKGPEIIRPLREITESIADLSEPMRFVDLQTFLDDDYPDGMLYYWKSAYLKQLDDEVYDIVIDYANKRPSKRSNIDIWYGSGAINRVSSEKTAFARRDMKYLLAMEANWTDPAQSEANISWARNCFEDMQRFTSGSYLNFPGFMEDGDKLLRGAYENNFKRLQSVKAKYDPNNLFQGALNITPKV